MSEKNYYKQRMKELGATPKNTVVKYTIYEGEFEKSPVKEVKEYPLFTEDDQGNIEIHYFNRDGFTAQYQKKGAKYARPYVLKRLRNPVVVDKSGKKDIMKYLIPKGAGTFPFLPPVLIEKFKARQKIKTLVLTEGAFKAFKGSLHGLDVIAFTSITHYKDKHTLELHRDVIEIIKACEVEEVIWLVDGDCLDLTKDFPEVDPEADLYRRPAQFFSTCIAIKELMREFDVTLYFAHIKSDGIKGNPKGLDDLYVELIGQGMDPKAITQDIVKITGRPDFVQVFNISSRLNEVKQYFGISNADSFYLKHQIEIGDQAFVFNGTKYKWNSKEEKCDVLVPSAARNYFRVGCDYFREVEIANKYGMVDRQLAKWKRPTIVEDHGPNFLKHIPKLNGFCITPNHQNHQKIIRNCYNLYHPFEWTEREDGDWGNIKGFLEHIFGKGIITRRKKINGKTVLEKYKELDLGLDYIQLLYTKPQQILPILCLVSKEKNTGKTTFANLMKAIFTQNAVFVGNDDLSNDFNASWASRLLVLCEEVFIDKKQVVEKLKALSTAQRMMVNQKGVDQQEREFFAKFILLSNNEENFVYADPDENRFWVRKIQPFSLDDVNVHLLDNMIEEIPAFLNFLDNRKLATRIENRGWFHPELTKTDALKKVVEYSRPTIIREITSNIKDMFLTFDKDEIMLDTNLVREVLLSGQRKYENNYIDKCLKDMGLDRFRDPDTGKTKAIRYAYPKWDHRHDATSGSNRFELVEAKAPPNRPWVFLRAKFFSAEEIAEHESNPEIYSLMPDRQNGQESGDNLNEDSKAFDHDDKADDDDLPF